MSDLRKFFKMDELQEETTVVDMNEFVSQKVMIGSEECTTQIQIEMLAKHGKTMLMMYEATNDNKYLKQARLDYHRAKSLQECGFVRPLGCYLAA